MTIDERKAHAERIATNVLRELDVDSLVLDQALEEVPDEDFYAVFELVLSAKVVIGK